MSDEKNVTATAIHADQDDRMDLRRRRAEAFAQAVFPEIEDLFEGEKKEVLYSRLANLFRDTEASITTDEDRDKVGLEPRDAKGWTLRERADYERSKMEALQMTQVGMLNKNSTTS